MSMDIEDIIFGVELVKGILVFLFGFDFVDMSGGINSGLLALAFGPRIPLLQ